MAKVSELDIYYNVTGQELFWDAPEGRPSSITSVQVFDVTVDDDGTAEAATTGSASLENPASESLTASAGISQANPKNLPLSTASLEAGKVYLLDGADGDREWIKPLALSGTAATLAHPLRADYTTADAVKSTRIVISIDDTWAADEADVKASLDPNPQYRVRWVYVVDSKTVVWDSYFSLLRYKGDHDVTPLDMEAEFPGWLDRLPEHHIVNQGATLISKAYEKVQRELHFANVPDEAIRNRDVLNDLTVLKAIEMRERTSFYLNGGSNALELEDARVQFHRAMQNYLTVVGRTPIDTGSGASVVAKPTGITRR